MPPLSTSSSTPSPTAITLFGSVRFAEYHIAIDILTGLAQHCQQTGVEIALTFTPCCDLDFISHRQAKNKEANLVEALYPTLFACVENAGGKNEFLNLEMLVNWTKQTHDFNFVASKNDGEYANEAAAEFQKKLSEFKVCFSYT
jgi:hypothetical protein